MGKCENVYNPKHLIFIINIYNSFTNEKMPAQNGALTKLVCCAILLYSLCTLTPTWPFKLASIYDLAHTYIRSIPRFPSISQFRKFSNARPIYLKYWFIAVKTAPITSKWDHKMVQLLNLLKWVNCFSTYFRPVHCDKIRGVFL